MGVKVAVDQARVCMHVCCVPLAGTLSITIMTLLTSMPTQDGRNAGIPFWMSTLQTGLKTAICLDLYSGLSA